MGPQHNTSAPSQTALFTALRRALAHETYHTPQFGPDDLAIHFLPAQHRLLLHFGAFRRSVRRKLDAVMPGMWEYVIARTAYFDRLFLAALDRRAAQVVLLGAGYDSRPYRFAHANRSTTVFELDAPATQKRKLACLEAAGIHPPPEVQFVPIDFRTQSLADVLAQAGYRPEAETLFLWEGVTYYLDEASVNETLEVVRCARHAGSALAFDYSTLLTEANAAFYYGAPEFLKAMRQHHQDEAFMFFIPDGRIEAFLADRGLQVVEHYDPEGIEQAFLLYGQGALLGRAPGYLRCVLARAGE